MKRLVLHTDDSRKLFCRGVCAAERTRPLTIQELAAAGIEAISFSEQLTSTVVRQRAAKPEAVKRVLKRAAGERDEVYEARFAAMNIALPETHQEPECCSSEEGTMSHNEFKFTRSDSQFRGAAGDSLGRFTRHGSELALRERHQKTVAPGIARASSQVDANRAPEKCEQCGAPVRADDGLAFDALDAADRSAVVCPHCGSVVAYMVDYGTDRASDNPEMDDAPELDEAGGNADDLEELTAAEDLADAAATAPFIEPSRSSRLTAGRHGGWTVESVKAFRRAQRHRFRDTIVG
jgi:hypothetical protein